jgi:DNA-directed RNA polymerase subunit K/omega
VRATKIREQTREILDPEYRKRVDQSLKEAAEGKVKHFKDAKEMLDDLHPR